MARQRRALRLAKSQLKIVGCGSPIIFIDSIAANLGIVEKKVCNIKINTDGNIATSWADFLLNEGKRADWDRESWQLVTGFCAPAIFNCLIN